ncbi:hypothetical protein [Streptomyces viridochromogenes]|uniref:hypothetical protein n=1 Tax=Streptomyces viridochromogenes TaxID=1938 RepID=UPI000B1B9FC0
MFRSVARRWTRLITAQLIAAQLIAAGLTVAGVASLDRRSPRHSCPSNRPL